MREQFRFTGFFPAWVRSFLSDFAVIIGILLMTGLDYYSGIIRVAAFTPMGKIVIKAPFKRGLPIMIISQVINKYGKNLFFPEKMLSIGEKK